MEPGSIEEIVARLELWCKQSRGGLARVEWDSIFAREDVISKLSLDRRVVEVEVPFSNSPFENVKIFLKSLSALAEGDVVSITGIEGLVLDAQTRLETLAALSFRREQLAALRLNQIWWIPAHLSQQIILGVPDLDSWFQLRLHLAEIPPSRQNPFESFEPSANRSFTVDEARALATRFWTNSSAASDQNAPVEQIWGFLAQPAYTALTNAGLVAEARQVLDEFSKIVSLPKYEARVVESSGFDLNALKAVNEFALALSARGDYLQAGRWLELVLASNRRNLGDDHLLTLTAMNNLASMLDDQGDLAGARMLQEQVLSVVRRVFGEEHPRSLTAMNNLASTFRSEGKFKEAQVLQERVLSASRRVLGDNHPNTLAAMNNLAITLNERRDLSGARALQEEAVLKSIQVLGERDLRTLRTRHNLAETLRDQGDLSAARTQQEQILAIMRGALGDEHPDTLTAMNNLALTLSSQGDLSGARVLQELVLDVTRRELGDKHLNTLRAMNNLASTLRDQGEFETARVFQEDAMTAAVPLLGANHPNTLTIISNLAQTLRSQGDLAGAHVLEEQVQAALLLRSPSSGQLRK